LYFLPASQKRLLNSLNPLVAVLFAFVLILLRSTMDPLLPSVLRHADIMLPFVVYLGQRRALAEGLILSLFVSHLFSLCSAAPIGVFTAQYLMLFMVARLLSYVIYANRWFSILFLMFALAIVSHFLLWAIASLFGHGWGAFADGWGILGHAVLNALVGFAIYVGMSAVDRMTFKAPRINIELGEGEL
jgi:hypothetical protein